LDLCPVEADVVQHAVIELGKLSYAGTIAPPRRGKSEKVGNPYDTGSFLLEGEPELVEFFHILWCGMPGKWFNKLDEKTLKINENHESYALCA
jgi:hypothetical protein